MRVDHAACSTVVIAPWVVHDEDGIVAVCLRQHHAERIAELLDRHGIVDVPETAEGING